MRNVYVNARQLEELACRLARDAGIDPYVNVSPGRHVAVIPVFGNYHVSPALSFPAWYLFKPMAQTALAFAGNLLDVTVTLLTTEDQSCSS